MKLYYSPGACSLAVRIVINEIGAECQFESVDLKTKKTETGANYLETNPKGSVPVLVLNNKEILTENAVIQQYLADEYKAKNLLPPVGDFKRYRVLEWLNYVSTEIHKGSSPLFHPKIPGEVKEDIFKPGMKAKLKFLDQHLAHHKYLMGNEFTLPDGYLFVVLRWQKYFGIMITEFSNVARYFEEVKNRKSVQQSMKEEGLT